VSEKILQVNEEAIKSQLGRTCPQNGEETLNELLEKEADVPLNAARYERSVERAGHRAGHYGRGLTTSSGQIALKMPKLKGAPRKQTTKLFYHSHTKWHTGGRIYAYCELNEDCKEV